MCLNQALPKVQIRCFQPPKEASTECNHGDAAGFTQLQCNGEISHHLVYDTWPICKINPLGLSGGGPLLSWKASSIQKASMWILSYKVTFKAGPSKDKTESQTQNMSLYSHTCPCAKWGWRLNTWGGSSLLGYSHEQTGNSPLSYLAVKVQKFSPQWGNAFALIVKNITQHSG